MNVSSCLKSNLTENYHMFILFGRVIPYLVNGLLFGGIPPYLLHITCFKWDELDKGRLHRIKQLGKIGQGWYSNGTEDLVLLLPNI